MQLKEGYKQTEIGILPKDWDAVELGEILYFKNGLNKESEFFGYGTPIVNYMDVFSNYGITKDKIQGLVAVNNQEIQNFSAQKGDVFFTRTSETVEEIGISAVLLEDIKKCVFSGFVLRGRNKKESLTLDFKKFCFSSSIVRNQIVSTSSYTTRALTNGKLLSSIYIPVPSEHKEQQAIATALSEVDTLITNLDKLITKKKAIKQGAMQQLLKSPSQGGKRLPGFDGEWVEKELRDIAPLQRGFDLTNSSLKKGSYPVVYSNGISNYHNSYMVKGPGLVTGRSGTIGNVFYIEEDFWPHNTSLWVTSFKGNSPLYVFYLYQSIGLDRFGTGSGVPTLNRNDVHDFKVSIPPTIEEQNTIAKTLSDMDKDLESLEQKKSKYIRIKQGMMQELLTGKTRLI